MTVLNAVPNGFTQLTNSAQWERLMISMGIPDCVAGKPGSTDLQPSLNSGARTVVMQAGDALIRGQLWGVTTNTTVSTAIPAAVSKNRIDKLVVRYNRAATTAATIVQPVVITGTPSATPAPPSIQSTTTIQDIPIAQWQSNSDGTLVSLQDIRTFASYPVLLFTSGQRPTPAKPTIGVETDTDAILIWNGTTWRYITPTFGQDTDLVLGDTTLTEDGKVKTLCSVTFIGDGVSQAEIIASIPGVYRDRNSQSSITVKGTVGSGNNVVTNSGTNPVTVFTDAAFCSAIMSVSIDGNEVDRKWLGIPNSVPNDVTNNGAQIYFRTSIAGGNTPGKGNHTVTLTAWVIEGNHDIVVNGGPSFPVRLQVGPVFQ